MLEGRWLLYMFKWIFQTKAEHKARPSFWIDNFHRTGRWYAESNERYFVSLFYNSMNTTATAVFWKYKFQNRPEFECKLFYREYETNPDILFVRRTFYSAHNVKGAVCVILSKVGRTEGARSEFCKYNFAVMVGTFDQNCDLSVHYWSLI